MKLLKEKLKNTQILFVEDDPDARLLMHILLKRYIRSIEVAESGKEGLEKAQNMKFDLILTDINLPGISGLDMLMEIRKFSNVPAIVLSAHNEEEYFEKAKEIGILEYITKPIVVGNLENALRKFVDIQELKTQNQEVSVKTKEAS